MNISPLRKLGQCQTCGRCFGASLSSAPSLCRINEKIVCIQCGDKIIENLPRRFLWWTFTNKIYGRVGMSLWVFSWLLMMSWIPLTFYVSPLFIMLVLLLFLNVNWPLYAIETPSERIGFERYICEREV